jgi:hypothetical protein
MSKLLRSASRSCRWVDSAGIAATIVRLLPAENQLATARKGVIRPGVRPSLLLFTRILMRRGKPVALSSFGGEGQGEEVVVHRRLPGAIFAAGRWNVATNRRLDSGGPPLPDVSPPKEERESRSPVVRVRQMRVRCSGDGRTPEVPPRRAPREFASRIGISPCQAGR